MQKHYCHAIGCIVEVEPRFLMCRPHWYMVPEDQRLQVWNEYRPGQEVDKKPSKAYLDAAQAAIAYVAAKEKDSALYTGLYDN